MAAPMIYPSIPGSTPLFVIWWGVFGSQNLPHPHRIYPSFSTNVRPSENLPLPPRTYRPFSTTICNPPRIHPSLPEYTPPFLTNLYVRPSQNLLIPSRIHPSFQPICMCDPPRINTPPPENIPPFSTTICDPSRIYPLPEFTPPPPFQQMYMCR